MELKTLTVVLECLKKKRKLRNSDVRISADEKLSETQKALC